MYKQENENYLKEAIKLHNPRLERNCLNVYTNFPNNDVRFRCSELRISNNNAVL